MLGHIRDSMQGWIAWAIIGLLIIPFALWGIQEYFGGAGPLVVASVNGEDISKQSYQDAFYQQRDRMRQMMGGQYNPDIFDERIKQQALDELIERELLFQEADKAGFSVSQQDVYQYIQNIESFQEDGKFSNDFYIKALESQGESPVGFENRVQRAILTQQLYSAMSVTTLATQSDINKILSLQEQTREISYLIIPAANFKNDEVATDESIEKYYNEHLEQYMTQDQVSIEYVELNAANLGSDAIPTEEELKQYYQDRLSQYVVSAERKTSHILVSVDEGADEKTIDAARSKAKDIKSKIDKGEDFAALVSKFSDDPGSSKMGGDIGFFGKNALDPNYEKTMYSLKVGEVSEPVLSSFGFHIIKLDEVRAEKSKAFEEVRGDIVAEFKQSAADKKFFELSEKLTNLAYEVPDSLNDAAGATEVEIKTTPLFGRGGGVGIAANPKVASAAFSEDLIKQGYNSDPIEISENHVVVIRVKEYKEKAQKPLEEVKAIVKATIVSENSKKMAKQTGEDTIKTLSTSASDEDKLKIAKELKLEWKESGALKRDDKKVNVAIVKAAFKAEKPADVKPTIAGVVLPNGDYAVYTLAKSQDGDVSKLDEAKKLTVTRNLTGALGDADFNLFVKGLKDTASIVVQKENI